MQQWRRKEEKINIFEIKTFVLSFSGEVLLRLIHDTAM